MLFSGISGASSEFSSILSKTDDVGAISPLETIVNARLQIINNVAIIAALFIICSLSLTIISRGELEPTGSVLDKIEENQEETPKIPENNN